MFTRVRLHKNNEFAFKEVYDEKSFEENAIVVREVVELLQPFQIRYGHKQQFLGDFFELLLSTGIKQEAGQFFTPVPIAKFIISSLPLRELIKQKIAKDETHFLPYIIDYAAGSGHFLTESMDEVQNIINEIDESKQRPSVKRNLSSWKINPFDWAYDFVYGIEADYRLVKTAKVSCFLNGDGLANVIHADGLDHFQKSIDYKGKLKEVSKDDPKENGVFDVLIANPPYSVSAFKNTLKNGEESFDLYNRLTDDSSEIECLFIERTKQLLKLGGWAGIILPSSILSNLGIYTDARQIILKYFAIKAIAEFGSNTFMATGTNTVTLFLERRSNNDWKKIESAIKKFFDKPKEANVNGVEKAFGKYVCRSRSQNKQRMFLLRWLLLRMRSTCFLGMVMQGLRLSLRMLAVIVAVMLRLSLRMLAVVMAMLLAVMASRHRTTELRRFPTTQVCLLRRLNIIRGRAIVFFGEVFILAL